MLSRLFPAAVAMLCASAATSAVITLNVNRDSQTRAGWARNGNFGSAAEFYPTMNTGDSSDAYNVLLGFDLSAVEADVLSAALQVYKANASPSLPVTFTAYKGLNNDWVESEMTAVNRKAGTPWATIGGDYDLASASSPSTATTAGGVWVTVDVTAIVQSMKDSGWNYGTLFLKSSVNGYAQSSYARIAAKEGTMWTPTNPTAPTDKFAKLVVDSGPIPEPAAAALGAAGMGVLGLSRRRGRRA